MRGPAVGQGERGGAPLSDCSEGVPGLPMVPARMACTTKIPSQRACACAWHPPRYRLSMATQDLPRSCWLQRNRCNALKTAQVLQERVVTHGSGGLMAIPSMQHAVCQEWPRSVLGTTRHGGFKRIHYCCAACGAVSPAAVAVGV